VTQNFPAERQYVLESLGEVYHYDTLASEQGLSAQQRLSFHQVHSGPVMDQLQVWLRSQLEEDQVEPNSGLGEAIRFMLKRWDKLTRFLRQARAPLDNAICERALKKAVLHRKNALFYKTENGAAGGRSVHELDSHGAVMWRQCVRLSHSVAETREGTGRPPRALDAMELECDAGTIRQPIKIEERAESCRRKTWRRQRKFIRSK
jgi:hypothetical protein